MKVAVSAVSEGVQAPVDQRFGRCTYFVFVDTDTGEAVSRVNNAVASGHGAGVQAAQFVVQEGAEAVISGRVGPNAFQVLTAAGVQVCQSTSQTVAAAVEAFRSGELVVVGGPTGPAHAGSRRR
ncbi:MAG: NifB/NifX family molybdenum-iron cluster-binding protein [Anaerolineae bacterium]|nr:NifB/NifX family molybdenum-iron cluster-binding protein [Anaerolineae bacterium]